MNSVSYHQFRAFACKRAETIVLSAVRRMGECVRVLASTACANGAHSKSTRHSSHNHAAQRAAAAPPTIETALSAQERVVRDVVLQHSTKEPPQAVSSQAQTCCLKRSRERRSHMTAKRAAHSELRERETHPTSGDHARTQQHHDTSAKVALARVIAKIVGSGDGGLPGQNRTKAPDENRVFEPSTRRNLRGPQRRSGRRGTDLVEKCQLGWETRTWRRLSLQRKRTPEFAPEFRRAISWCTRAWAHLPVERRRRAANGPTHSEKHQNASARTRQTAASALATAAQFAESISIRDRRPRPLQIDARSAGRANVKKRLAPKTGQRRCEMQLRAHHGVAVSTAHTWQQVAGRDEARIAQTRLFRRNDNSG
jgi:hypothetical protein